MEHSNERGMKQFPDRHVPNTTCHIVPASTTTPPRLIALTGWAQPTLKNDGMQYYTLVENVLLVGRHTA